MSGKAIRETLAALGVIASMVFVGMEIRSNTVAAKAAAYQDVGHWGTKYVVVAEVEAPDGNPLTLATEWISRGGKAPELVTAYPIGRNS